MDKIMVGFQLRFVSYMRKFLKSFIYTLVLLVFIGKTNSFAISFEEALDEIVLNNPEIRLIIESREQVLRDYNIAKTSYSPSLYVTLSRIYEKDQPLLDPSVSDWASTNKFEAFFEQRLFDANVLGQIKRYKQLMYTEEYQNQKILEQLILTAIISYYDIIQAEYTVSIMRDYLRQIKEVERVVIAMYKNGDATLGDVNFTQSRVANSSSSYIAAYANLDKTKVRLAYLLGLVDPENEVDPKQVLPDLSSTDFFQLADQMMSYIPLTLDELNDEILKNNPDMKIVRSNICAAAYEVDSNRGSYLPTVKFLAELNNEEQESGTGYTRFGKFTLEARYDILDGGYRKETVKKTQSIMRELENTYAVLARDTRDTAFSLYTEIKSLERRRVAILKEIEATEEVDKVYSLQFKFATRNLTDRLDNLERMVNAKISLVSLDYDTLVTRISILQASGNLVNFFGFDELIEYRDGGLC